MSSQKTHHPASLQNLRLSGNRSRTWGNDKEPHNIYVSSHAWELLGEFGGSGGMKICEFLERSTRWLRENPHIVDQILDTPVLSLREGDSDYQAS